MRIFERIHIKLKSGTLRCTFVHEGLCRWKTTVFVEEVEEAHRILGTVCRVVKATYQRQSLSITKSDRGSLLQYLAKFH